MSECDYTTKDTFVSSARKLKRYNGDEIRRDYYRHSYDCRTSLFVPHLHFFSIDKTWWWWWWWYVAAFSNHIEMIVADKMR